MRLKTNKIQAVLATHNLGKLRELQTALLQHGWHLQGLSDYNLPIPDETGDTFEANAFIKAEAAAKATGLWALADDSGIEVDALDGKPGVYTSDFGGWEKLIQVMERIRSEDRTARFRCVLALARQGLPPLYFHGNCEGRISPEGRGNGGFGYDPVFIPEGESRTFAEMSQDEKYAYSHRGKAIQALLAWASADAQN